LLATSSGIAQDRRQPYVAQPDADGVQRVRIVGGSYFFKPNHIIAKVNVPLELSVSRESGIAPHDLILQAPEASLEVDESLSTEEKKIMLTPTAVGTYPFYCSKKLPFVASHRQRGMEGVLEVVR
jgi:plastocyanin domain-containing protein